MNLNVYDYLQKDLFGAKVVRLESENGCKRLMHEKVARMKLMKSLPAPGL